MSTPRSLHVPPGVRALGVATAGTRFATLQATPAVESGLPILLVPGWTGSKEDFLAVLEPLAALGHPVVALDLRGQYQTPETTGPTIGADAYSVTGLGRDVLDVARSCHPEQPAYHLVGHSFGGLVARAATLSSPGEVASVSLLCSGPGALPRERHRKLRLMANAIDLTGLTATWWLKSLLDEAAPDDESIPLEVAQWLRDRFLSNSPRSLRSITMQLTTEPDRTTDLAATAVPVSVLFGEHDDGWPITQQEAMARRLGVPAVSIPGAGHSPAVDEPETTAQLVASHAKAAEGRAELHDGHP